MRLLKFSVVILLLSAAGCAMPGKPDEGIIVYDVTFPFLEDNILKNVFPEEMKFYYKEDQVKAELRSLGGIVTTGFVASEEDRILKQLLKNYQDRLMVVLNEDETNALIKRQPQLRLVSTDEQVEVAGYMCEVTIAEFTSDSMPPVRLLHTTELGIENPNWFNQYHEIEGVLLGYELEQFGMRMKLSAREVLHNEVNPEVFNVDADYRVVSTDEFRSTITGLLSEFDDL